MKRIGVVCCAGVVLASTFGCKGKSSSEKKSQPRVAATLTPPDEPFVFAAVKKYPASVPARFAAALPADPAALQRDWSAYPPPSYVADLLCAGDEGMQARLLGAATAAAETVSPDEIVGAFGELLGFCSEPAFCLWAQTVVNGEHPPPVRALLWHGLSRCTDEKYAADFAKPEAPADAVVSWTMAVSATRLPAFSARLVTSAREILQTGDAFRIRMAAVAVGSTNDPAALASLFELRQEAPDQVRKDAVAVGMYGYSDARAREVFGDACTRSRDALCPERGGRAAEVLPDPTADPLAALLDYRVNVGQVVHAYRDREPTLAEALARCVHESAASKVYSDWITYRCLSELEVLDRAGAVAQARKIEPSVSMLSVLRDGVAGLRAFETREALQKKLRGLGLMRKALPESAAGEPLLTVADALRRAGRFLQFDTETGMHPNQHDSLLRDLAKLVSPELDGVVFEEVAPPFEPAESGEYVLRAYMDDHRYSVQAQNLGDWYDVEAVLGLLNALLVEHKSQMRFALLPTGDQTSAVLAGPKPGLMRARAEGLIDFGSPGDAVRAGEDFDDRLVQEPKPVE